MDSLRFVVCARESCAQVFLLCTHCDRGQWYCSRACAATMRRTTLLDGLKRLQAETTAELDALLPAILDQAFKGGL